MEKSKIGEEAQDIKAQMRIKVSLWSWAGQGPSNALSPVHRAASPLLPYTQIQPGLFHKANLTYTQSPAEEVQQRDNYGLLEWAGLPCLTIQREGQVQ